MKNKIDLNVEARYNGYHIYFKVGSNNYDMETKTGNRGNMIIHLVSIIEETNEYEWKYIDTLEIFTNKYIKILKVDE